MSERYVALPDLPNGLDEANQLSWQLSIHPAVVDTERIVVDTLRLQRLARLSGLGGLVVSAYQDDVDIRSARPQGIVGINADGSVAAWATRSRVKADVKTELVPGGSAGQKTYDWPVGHVGMNSMALAAAATNRDPATSKEAAWAGNLNRELGRGMRKLAWQNLIVDTNGFEKVYAVWQGFAAATEGYFISHVPDARPAIVLGAIYLGGYATHAVRVGTDNMLNGSGNFFRDRRWSAWISDCQPDRFMAAAGYSVLGPLVGVRK